MTELIEKLVDKKNEYKENHPWVEPFWKMFKNVEWGLHITDKGKIVGQYTAFINDDLEVDYRHSTKPGLVWSMDKNLLEEMLDDSSLDDNPVKILVKYFLPNIGRGIKLGWKKKPKF